MAWESVFLSALSRRNTAKRAVFGQRIFDVVHNMFGWDCGRCCDDGVAVACAAQLVLRTLEKLFTTSL